MVIEGNLYSLVCERLLDEHKLIFERSYDINNSALGTIDYDITNAIKFIIKEEKLPLLKNRIIILTENGNNYSEYEQNQHNRVRVFNSEEFLKRIDRFKSIKENYNEVKDALITAFFVD